MKKLYTENAAARIMLLDLPGYEVIVDANITGAAGTSPLTDCNVLLTGYDYGAIYGGTDYTALIDNNNVINTKLIPTAVMLNRINRSGILTTPNYVSAVSRFAAVANVGKGSHIVKVAGQARSLGKCVINNRFELIQMITSVSNNISREAFNKKFSIDPGHYRNDDEKYILHNALVNNHSIIIQELVEVKQEFRILYMEGVRSSEYIVEYRTGYTPNSVEERFHTTDLPFEVLDGDVIRLSEKVREFGDYLDVPAVALDVYITPAGEIGAFEYSFDFGMDYSVKDLETMSKQYSAAVLSRLK